MSGYEEVTVVGFWLMMAPGIAYRFLGFDLELMATISGAGFFVFGIGMAAMAYRRIIYPQIMRRLGITEVAEGRDSE